MQHIVHIFIGEELVSFRDLFASNFRRMHQDFEKSLFTALSLTIDDEQKYILNHDENGDAQDGITITNENIHNGLLNYFEDLYSRKVTVVNPGNQSMIVVLWVKLFLNNVSYIVKNLKDALASCNSNFSIEISGFTNDSVACFMPNSEDRLAPDIYKKNFDDNLSNLKELRPSLSAFRLISDRNLDNVSLGFNEESLALVCSEYASLMCKHYLSIHPTVIDSQEFPFETFGLSSMIFDVDYYKSYIRNRILIDKLEEQGIDRRAYNINSLASSTNPILNEIIAEIHNFYNTKVAHAKAALSLTGESTSSDIVGSVDKDIKNIVESLRKKIYILLRDEHISIFEREALLALILGDDCSMFESSAVSANETTIEDIIDESTRFFVDHDEDHSILRDISQEKIKDIRNRMRNIAVANRNREDRLEIINKQQKDSVKFNRHIHDSEYIFGDVSYKLNLNIDEENLEKIYEPHNVSDKNIDLRHKFASIRNQGGQGSCASFAVASVIESLVGAKNHYSPAFLYWNAREINESTNKDTGASLYDVIKVASSKGDCKEESMPYQADTFTLAPSAIAIEQALECRVIEAKTVEPKLTDIKSALSDGYPVIIAAKIFDSFSETKKGFVRLPSSEEATKSQRSDRHGTHAMVVCGFSDEERIFVVRNSWGNSFGDKGYCYIPYAYAQQYFLQACIITELSTSSSKESDSAKHTISFNMGDSSIEAAVIQTLVDEDKFKLENLAQESSNIKTAWTQNVATLGNVNNQTEIIRKAKGKLDDKIQEEKIVISELQSSKNDKLFEFKNNYVKGIIYVGLACFVAWILTCGLYEHSDIFRWTAAVAIVLTAVLIVLIGAFGFQWRKYRQDLRDEIQRHSNKISRITAEKASLDIKAHLHGTILREVDDLRSELRSRYMLTKAFNDSWISIYDDKRKVLKDMTPEVPYPFISVLDNNLLDKYYAAWKAKMLKSIDFDTLLIEFQKNPDLKSIIQKDVTLQNSAIRGLKDFSMKEYVTMKNNSKWQFLPSSAKMSTIIPNLDYRAKPFCPYNQQNSDALEKYIFIKDVSQEELKDFSNYFSQPPMLVLDSDPYSICILNITRYNLRS